MGLLSPDRAASAMQRRGDAAGVDWVCLAEQAAVAQVCERQATMASYEAYMLRVWHRASARDHRWVGRLEQLTEGTVSTFHRPQDLLAALAGLLERSPGVPAQPRLPRDEQGGQGS
jgi:hypothetical protein